MTLERGLTEIGQIFPFFVRESELIIVINISYWGQGPWGPYCRPCSWYTIELA